MTASQAGGKAYLALTSSQYFSQSCGYPQIHIAANPHRLVLMGAHRRGRTGSSPVRSAIFFGLNTRGSARVSR
jgi:hypothetical protein